MRKPAIGKKASKRPSKRDHPGTFPLRMTPEQHRRTAVEAAETGMPTNQLPASRI